jgi:hypothetical protein
MPPSMRRNRGGRSGHRLDAGEGREPRRAPLVCSPILLGVHFLCATPLETLARFTTPPLAVHHKILCTHLAPRRRADPSPEQQAQPSQHPARDSTTDSSPLRAANASRSVSHRCVFAEAAGLPPSVDRFQAGGRPPSAPRRAESASCTAQARWSRSCDEAVSVDIE